MVANELDPGTNLDVGIDPLAVTDGVTSVGAFDAEVDDDVTVERDVDDVEVE